MAAALTQRTHTVATAAEQVVERLDTYTQEQHAEFLKAARERAEAKKAARRERARAAAARLRSAS